jgi:uncharacterized membrane protein
MDYGSTGFDIIKWLHILCAIIGFGGVLLNGLYASKASKRTPAEALAVTEVNFQVSEIAQYFIYATILLGFGVVGASGVPGQSDHLFSFSQTWVWLSLTLAVVGIGISHGLLRPRVKALIETQREVAAAGAPSPEQATTLAARGKAIAPVAAVLDLIFVAILLMMVFRWGGPKV